MKTKTIELYTDLFPGWHENLSSQCYVTATSQPCFDKPPTALRVKITVELPEHYRQIPVDESVEGSAILST